MSTVGAKERALINAYQRDFPLESRPFKRIAEGLEETETEIISAVRNLVRRNILSRLGAVVCPNTAGSSTLAAMAVPQERLEEVAEMVNAEPAVNHNYEREHMFNLWFVVTACDENGVRETLKRIEEKTGLEVLDLPLEKSYHIDLGFPI